jgi:thiamine biosynthesis lipoprotein
VGTDLVGTNLGDLAVATSGTAERGEHIAGPDRRAAPGAFASVTVVGPRLAEADAFATAAFAMGERARDWLATVPDYRGFAICPDGRTWTTGRWGDAEELPARPAA